ncbi:hypothetical protein PRUB_a0619 [Pseudoalteromonas rubra]|uniref:Uncharacterized protein n=2 Tax=Pseudoalteromonas rubra TaxID=43658 RepID=A0A8T0C846_9GAMM|nr:hypothetical protein PRUB_a0619 [Pseudoalteromonas rubra]
MVIFSSKSAYSIIFTLGMSIFLVISFWGIMHWVNNAETVERVERQSMQWKGFELTEYSFIATDACMFVDYSKVQVVEGKPQLLEGKQKVTIEGRFDLAKEAILNADALRIEYHPLYGFPVNIEVDWDDQVVDDECSYSIKEFKVP